MVPLSQEPTLLMALSFLSLALSPGRLLTKVSLWCSLKKTRNFLWGSAARSIRRLYTGVDLWRTSSSTVCASTTFRGPSAASSRSIWSSTTLVSNTK